MAQAPQISWLKHPRSPGRGCGCQGTGRDLGCTGSLATAPQHPPRTHHPPDGLSFLSLIIFFSPPRSRLFISFRASGSVAMGTRRQPRLDALV